MVMKIGRAGARTSSAEQPTVLFGEDFPEFTTAGRWVKDRIGRVQEGSPT